MQKLHTSPDTFLYTEDSDHHLYIVNFAKLFEVNIQLLLLDDLKKYYSVDKKLNKDAKAFFYHHIVFGVCNYILNLSKTKGHKIILYNNINDLKDLEIYSIFAEEEVKPLISKILDSIKRYLPIRLFKSSHSYYYFMGVKGGKLSEILTPIRAAGSESFSHYTFDKALKYAKKHNLTFLNNTYFKDLKTKQLMFS